MDYKAAIDLLDRLQDPEPWEPQITANAFDLLEMAKEALRKVYEGQASENEKMKQRIKHTRRIRKYERRKREDLL